jgi:porin
MATAPRPSVARRVPMQIPVSQSFERAAVCAAVGAIASAGLAGAAPFPRQDAGAGIASATDSADVAELIPAAASGLPPVLPGQEPGARTRPGVSPESEGTADHHEWERATGDWGGVRTRLEQLGIVIDGSLVTEWSRASDGGTDSGGIFRHLLDINATLDLSRLIGFEGADVFIDFQTGGAWGAPDAWVGFQPYSNIAIDGSITQLSQLWYEQWLAGDSVRVKIGKVDANSEFAYIDAAGGFINASAGFTPAIFALPTYPNPSMSVNLFVYPTEDSYIGAGVYDGATAVDGVDTGALGPAGFFSSGGSNDWFVIGEAGVTFDRIGALDRARIAIGGWWHSGEFTTDAGTAQDGASGAYALAEARAWRPDGADADDDDTRGLWVFVQFGSADDGVNPVRRQFGAGASLEGTLPARDADALGLYMSFVDLDSDSSGGSASDECAIELFYDIEITPCVHLKPDIQWFLDAGGSGGDSFAGTLRCTIAF